MSPAIERFEKTVRELHAIPLEKIVPHERNARDPKSVPFDDDELRNLADSIARIGILLPLIVTAADDEGRYHVIAGRRRFEAAKLAGLAAVPAIIRQDFTDDAEAAAIASLAENVQRVELAPLELATAYQRIIASGLSKAELARRLGKSRPFVANTIRLRNLTDPVREALRAGRISATQALYSLRLRGPQRVLTAKLPLGGDVSLAEFVRRVEQLRSVSPKRRTKKQHAEARPHSEPKTRRLSFPIRLVERFEHAASAAERRRAAAALVRELLRMSAPKR